MFEKGQLLPTMSLTRRAVLSNALAAAFLHVPAQRGAASDARAPRDLVAARQKFFGSDNVDPDTGAVRPDAVILSWFGVTNYAVAMGGRVFLLDAWVPRGTHTGYLPTSARELVRLAPEAIFLGHGHVDHAADAAEIAADSGAMVVGTVEHCAQVQRQAGATPLRHLAVGTANDLPGTGHELSLLDGIGVTAVKHLHSAVRAPDRSAEGSPPLFAPPSPRDVIEHPPSPQDAADTLSHLGDAEGGSLLYQFRTPGFRLTWHDTAGPLLDDAPHVLERLRALPRTDVHLGSIQGFNQYSNGLRDPRSYVEALRPKVFVPGHHDNWAPPVSSRAEHYRDPLASELARIPEPDRPEVRFLSDPADYVRPEALTFEL